MDNQLNLSNPRSFVVKDLVRKLVTSTSASFIEEPVDIEDAIIQSSTAPKCIRPEFCREPFGSPNNRTILQFCFAFLSEAPEGVDPNFGKYFISDMDLSRFEVKFQLFERMFPKSKMERLPFDFVDDNVCSAILMGSAIYSWVEKIYDVTNVLDHRYVGDQDMVISRITRTQIPLGDYVYRFINVVSDAGTGEVICINPCTVVLKVEAEKGQSSRSKKAQSRKTDDVTEELEK